MIDVIGVDKVHIIGNSMGGHSAVAFALANPSRVGKLVLMGGGTGGVSPFNPGPTEGIKLIGALYRDPTMENLQRMMNVFVYDTSNLTQELFQARLDNMLAEGTISRTSCAAAKPIRDSSRTWATASEKSPRRRS